MKIKVATACLAASLLMMPILGHTQDSDTDRAHPKIFVKDSVITAKIKAKLAAEKPASLAHIHVDTDANGIVWLSGTARTKEEAEKAHSIAHATEGVKSVKNHIEIKKDD
jgi:hyperosmotically inducible periplasmic protein